MSLKGRTAFITGASRGIGLEIGKALARRGANVAVAAKTADPHPKLPGTIHTAVSEIDEIGERHNTGARGLALQLDIRDADAVEAAIEKTVERFGALDIVVNNASAINMKPTVEASVKSYDLMNGINARGTYLVSRFALPHLLRSSSQSRNPHILTLSPPLTYNTLSPSPADTIFPGQLAQTGTAYAIAKFGMSLATLALAAETQGKVGVNALWPYTLIGTSAMKIVSNNQEEEKRWRSPEIVSEAAVRVLEERGDKFTAQFLIDEVYLRTAHKFTHNDLAAFSLGGSDTPFEDLAEDLYISQQVRDEVARVRRSA
ncbi:uncharacterized protein PFL1_05072 [Pseudozyma flocculosa PF-1]|uniref:Hydroxysteroid dehydrogenase-like protein 2 n=1 Tax=Pseudozyma flocculosa PF-1 TaxID=1277687 RepID=A0A061H533_9BASI|nr:uncharacterized protein PFL1_05072 [Pseudozyma flocculosa PF-1]EPQ27534.1 hypothetical protein PFL1_05072 [Pseudozyma flocculosa PF-1]